MRGCGSAHPSLSSCISRNRRPSYNAKPESCIKTLKVEAVDLISYETFADVTADLPRPLRARPPESSAVRGSPRLADGQNLRVILSSSSSCRTYRFVRTAAAID